MALGGAGTASARPNEAGIFNPALLASAKFDRNPGYFLHANAGVRLLDRNNFIDRVEALSESGELEFDSNLGSMHDLFADGNLQPDDIRKVTGQSRDLLNELESLSDAPLRTAASAGFSFGKQTDRWSFASGYRRYLVVGAQVKISPLDVQRLNQMFDTVDAVANVLEGSQSLDRLLRETDFDDVISLIERDVDAGEISDELRNYQDIPSVSAVIKAIEELRFDVESLDEYIDLEGLLNAAVAQNQGRSLEELGLDGIEIRDYLRYQIPEEFHSAVEFSGAEVEEFALSAATDLAFAPDWSLGVTLKQQWIEAIGFSQSIQNIDFDAFLDDSNRRSHSRANIDIGLDYDINPYWNMGIVVKNLIPFEVEAPYGKGIVIDTIARAAVAYQRKDITWTLDYDLTRNEPLGFDPDKQYIATGVDWRIFAGNHLRLGYRYNLVDETGTPSLGMAFGGETFFADFAVTASDRNDEYGLALQTGLHF
nr:conjugal transfer protein TraF [Microbulbifer sp. ALW1]